jgi:hypothetical protein
MTKNYLFRFIYGGEMSFAKESIELAILVYEFAQKMEIGTLVNELEKFLPNTKASEMFAVFEILLKSGKHQTLIPCKQVRSRFLIKPFSKLILKST